MVRTVFDVQSLSKDIEFVTNIIKQNSGKSLGAIQFKGKRYKANNLVSLKYTLIKEKEALEAKLDHNDANIFHYFLKEEAELGVSNPQLKSQVLKYTAFKEELKELKATEVRVKEKCAFFAMELQTAMIHSHIKSLQHAEIDFKAAIEKIVKEDTFRVHIKASELKFLERYVQNKLQYFALRNYIQADLEILFAAIAAFNSVLERPVLMQKKQLLDYMATLVSEEASAA